MQLVQSNLVENETRQAQQSGNACVAASASTNKAAGEKQHSDRQPTAADATYATFVWLFGSGCF